MIQIDPKARLGCNPDSMYLLKHHKFFENIDFAMVSKKSYKGVMTAIEELDKRIEEE